jgi:hypothetical protein
MKMNIKDAVWNLMELRSLSEEMESKTLDESIKRAEDALSKATSHLRGESFTNPKYYELISKYEKSWHRCHNILTGGFLVRKDIMDRIRG